MFLPTTVFLLLFTTAAVRADQCPSSCLCSEDFEYPDGLLVDCENVGLDSIPMDIPAQTSTLLLNYNTIKSLDGLQYFHNIRILEVQHNYLENLETEILQALSYLRILVLSENKIQRIPSRAFRGLNYLEWVDFRSNKINSIASDAFYKAPSINYLNLVGNDLRNVDDGTFLPLTSYTLWLMLGNNSLTELPGDIQKMTGIQYLSVASNKLQYLPPQSLMSNTHLRTLDISHNQIPYLHQGTFSGISLQKLSGEGNPWQCDCYMEWLRVYTHTHQLEESIRCQEPRMFADQPLASLAHPLICVEPVIAAPRPVMRVVEFTNSTIECLVTTGDPPPKVYWYKDGRPLDAQANRFYTVQELSHQLVFQSVLYTDGGEYMCLARSPGSEPANATINLEVLYSPKIVNSYKWSPSGDDGTDTDVTLSCDVIANPQLNRAISWVKDSREMSGMEEGVKIIRTSLGTKLHLTNSPVVDNSGTYQCVASNSLGQASEAFHVTHNDMMSVRSGGSGHTSASLLSLLLLLLSLLLFT